MTRFIIPCPSARCATAMAGALALSWSALTLAQHHRGPEFPVSLSDARAEANARFDGLDTNGDGVVGRTEFVDAPVTGRGDGGGKMLFRHGPGGDGPKRHGPKPPRDEGAPTSGPDGTAAGARGGREALEADLFRRLDKNDDGQLSEEEFGTAEMAKARHQMMRERRFDRLDRDSNGTLTREDMTAWIDRLAAMDADGDGVVTREEARAHHQARRDGNAGG